MIISRTIKIVAFGPAARTDLAQCIYAGLISAGRKAAKKVCIYLIVGAVAIPVVSWLAFKAGLTGDDTDGVGRSGLSLYTDAGTGCQYLSAGGSGITPRMDKDGYQICDDRPVRMAVRHD
ncbi:hypothetical protein ACS25C_16775 [Dickeya undicola]|uniref:Uncharacterized protein n=1 Tax=Dickeya undicola TaxID=1577887 RepID=A0ABX9WNJ1_9GAMM|nr:hypothetical protein [Dickeya undicola]RNM18559.1 hypothetical protein EFS38_19815 [Dickeya undicola]